MLHILPFTFHSQVVVCSKTQGGTELPAPICDCPSPGILHTLKHREEQQGDRQTLARAALCYFIVSGPVILV